MTALIIIYAVSAVMYFAINHAIAESLAKKLRQEHPDAVFPHKPISEKIKNEVNLLLLALIPILNTILTLYFCFRLDKIKTHTYKIAEKRLFGA